MCKFYGYGYKKEVSNGDEHLDKKIHAASGNPLQKRMLSAWRTAHGAGVGRTEDR